MKKSLSFASSIFMLLGCAQMEIKPSDQHLQAPKEAVASESPPPPLVGLTAPPPPATRQPTKVYSVAVAAAPVSQLLYAIARDARLDIDIASDIEGVVTLNARDRTLPHILDRIAAQIDMRWEIRDGVIKVQRDTPFLRIYRVNYINMGREVTSGMNISTQVGGGGSGGSGGGAAGNSSSTTIANSNQNNFWDTLIANIQDILRETDRILPQQPGGSGAGGVSTTPEQAVVTSGALGSTSPSVSLTQSPAPVTFREAAAVIANQATGIISVRATSKQHEQVKAFLDSVLSSARRQVMIEATVVEVELNQGSQSGIDWIRLAQGGNLGIGVRSLGPLQNVSNDLRTFIFPSATGATQDRGTTIGYNSNNFAAAIKLLSDFGQVKVLSSPKITTLNNQSAVLRVADNLVYFNVTREEEETEGGRSRFTYTSEINTVSVGFIMSVHPHIDDGNVVSLHVRPSITRLRGYARDPAPALTGSPINNLVPIIQTKEMESFMKIPSGSMVMLGGLMEDQQNSNSETFPGLEKSELAPLFGSRSRQVRKTELVVFLRPTVVTDPSVDGDFSIVKNRLPDGYFFNSSNEQVNTGAKR
jgi:MSHA biogenesis protein MshL